MTNIITQLSEDEDKSKTFTKDFLEVFLNPSFSAISKIEIDNLVFKILIETEVINEKDQVYNIAKQLNITPTKARNLLFQYELRQIKNEETLKAEIISAFEGIKFSKDGEYISLGIESPILKEEIKSRFKELKHFPDSSFASEILRISPSGLIDFIDSFLDEPTKNSLERVLKRAGHIPDSTLKGMSINVVKVLAKVAAGKAGEELASQAIDQAAPLAIKFLQNMMKGDRETLNETVDGLSGFSFA